MKKHFVSQGFSAQRCFVLCAVASLCVACTPIPEPRQIQDTFIIDAPFDAVWPAVIETFSELLLPIINMEKDSGLITTDWISFSSEDSEIFADCGGEAGRYAMPLLKSGKFNVFVKPMDPDSCKMMVTCLFSDRKLERDCVSTGRLELKIYRTTLKKIGQ